MFTSNTSVTHKSFEQIDWYATFHYLSSLTYHLSTLPGIMHVSLLYNHEGGRRCHRNH